MAVSVIKRGMESNYAKDDFRTVTIAANVNHDNVEDIKSVLLPYMMSRNTGSTILNVINSGYGRSTFIISNSSEYSIALQLSWYLYDKIRLFRYTVGNWVVTDITGTQI